ncbi:lysM domain-containing protein [Colletotrichum higginsianum]|nr:lysM domain-containing protein [Colletotrichum higginsianum]
MSPHIKSLTALAFLPLAFGFNLWPLVETEALAEILQIAPACVVALNSTVACDQDLFQRTINVDGLWWQEQDVTTLCGTGCLTSARDWHANVESSCAYDLMIQGDRLVEADTLSGRFLEGLELACTRSASNEWCFIEQQEWTGSDMVTPDCAANPADPFCTNPGNVSAENRRISSLYDNDLLCSECFLKLLYARVTSAFLPDVDYSDYLVGEFQDIQEVCQTAVGELATRVLPNYPHTTDADVTPIRTEVTSTETDAPAPTTTTSEPVPTKAPVPDTEEGCEAVGWQWVDVLVMEESTIAETELEFCNEVAEIYGVATGDLMYTTNTPGASIAESASNATHIVNAVQIATWNPHILGACDHLVKDQYVCIDRPGGSWTGPPTSEIPDDSDGPVRGGPGTTPTLPIIDNPDTPPEPVQEGISSVCKRYVFADKGASCWKVSNDGGITQKRLFELNPVLGTNGENCDTMLWLNYYYCVGTESLGSPTTTVTRTTTSPAISPTASSTSAAPKPSPTQQGIVGNCNKWVQAVAGDYCWKLANDAGIDTALFYQWNTVLGSGGENCGTMIWPDYYYCIGVSSGSATTSSPPTTTTTTTTTTTSAGPAKPTATHAGIPANCSKFAEAPAQGASCWQLATDNGIELSRLYQLNPSLGTNGENCGTMIWPGYFYCVSVA